MKPREYLIKQDENGSFHLFYIGDEVVRCKNCKRRGKVMICPMWDQKLSDYDYCSYGEKRGKEHD